MRAEPSPFSSVLRHPGWGLYTWLAFGQVVWRGPQHQSPSVGMLLVALKDEGKVWTFLDIIWRRPLTGNPNWWHRLMWNSNKRIGSWTYQTLSGANDAASNLFKHLFWVSSSIVLFFASGMSPKKNPSWLITKSSWWWPIHHNHHKTWWDRICHPCI